MVIVGSHVLFLLISKHLCTTFAKVQLIDPKLPTFTAILLVAFAKHPTASQVSLLTSGSIISWLMGFSSYGLLDSLDLRLAILSSSES